MPQTPLLDCSSNNVRETTTQVRHGLGAQLAKVKADLSKLAGTLGATVEQSIDMRGVAMLKSVDFKLQALKDELAPQDAAKQVEEATMAFDMTSPPPWPHG